MLTDILLFLFINFRKRKEGRERETLICYFTYSYIHLFLACALKPWPMGTTLQMSYSTMADRYFIIEQ